eukprot:1180950-Prorocentrum_minimum.AAC.3
MDGCTFQHPPRYPRVALPIAPLPIATNFQPSITRVPKRKRTKERFSHGSTTTGYKSYGNRVCLDVAYFRAHLVAARGSNIRAVRFP